MIRIAPSLLASDFGHLADQIIEVEKCGADWIHIDVMDGHFVPNITFGPPVVASIRKYTRLPFDVHLMVEDADKFIIPFRTAGADIITVHQESCKNLARTIRSIKKIGAKAGIVLKPATPVSTIKDMLEEIDLVLIMTVEPGFGSQQFIKSSLQKIQKMRKMIELAKKEIFLEVDGGIDKNTAKSVINAGADVLVAGTSIFKSNSIRTAVSSLRAASEKKHR